MTFWQFLKRRAQVQGALGDFAREAVADPEFPRGSGVTHDKITWHLEVTLRVPDDALQAFRRDWDDWMSGSSPHPSLFDRVRGSTSRQIVNFETERRRRRPRDLFPGGGPA